MYSFVVYKYTIDNTDYYVIRIKFKKNLCVQFQYVVNGFGSKRSKDHQNKPTQMSGLV